MNRSFFALFIALLIHLLFLLLYLRIEELKPSMKKIKIEKKIKVSLRELVKPKFIEKNISPKIAKKALLPKEILLMPKGSQIKNIAKYNPGVKAKKSTRKPKTNIKVIKSKVKKTFPSKEDTMALMKPKTVQKTLLTKEEEDSSIDWLFEDKSDEIIQEKNIHTSSGSNVGRDIRKLYGDEFGKLSPAQQHYILNNQEIMRRITQGVLNRQASVSNLVGINANKSNIIEFYLHPDGSMSDFKFLEKSDYFILDEITRVTMQYAYIKYPRPNEKTLIRYNVFYNLRRY